jgi:hypothetical protein
MEIQTYLSDLGLRLFIKETSQGVNTKATLGITMQDGGTSKAGTISYSPYFTVPNIWCILNWLTEEMNNKFWIKIPGLDLGSATYRQYDRK